MNLRQPSASPTRTTSSISQWACSRCFFRCTYTHLLWAERCTTNFLSWWCSKAYTTWNSGGCAYPTLSKTTLVWVPNRPRCSSVITTSEQVIFFMYLQSVLAAGLLRQVVFGLHLLQPRPHSLQGELLVEHGVGRTAHVHVERACRQQHQLDVVLVELVDHPDEASGRVQVLAADLGHVRHHNRVVMVRQAHVVPRAQVALADLLEGEQCGHAGRLAHLQPPFGRDLQVQGLGRFPGRSLLEDVHGLLPLGEGVQVGQLELALLEQLPVVDLAVQVDRLAVMLQHRDERLEPLPHQPVPVQVVWRSVAGGYQRYLLAESLLEDPLQDHGVRNVNHLELVQEDDPVLPGHPVGEDGDLILLGDRAAVHLVAELHHELVEMAPLLFLDLQVLIQQAHQKCFATARTAVDVQTPHEAALHRQLAWLGLDTLGDGAGIGEPGGMGGRQLLGQLLESVCDEGLAGVRTVVLLTDGVEVELLESGKGLDGSHGQNRTGVRGGVCGEAPLPSRGGARGQCA